jgi:hypothetical protein
LEVKLSLFADDIISYIKNKEHPKLLELANKFRKVSKYKINIQKSVAFLNTSTEFAEKEIPFKEIQTYTHI